MPHTINRQATLVEDAMGWFGAEESDAQADGNATTWQYIFKAHHVDSSVLHIYSQQAYMQLVFHLYS